MDLVLEPVRDRVLRAAEHIPAHQLGKTGDCGFSPFENDTSTGRDTAFAKIKARVIGTELAKALNCQRCMPCDLLFEPD